MRFPVRSETFVLRHVIGLLTAGHDTEVATIELGDFAEAHGRAGAWDLAARTIHLCVPENPTARIIAAPIVLARLAASRPTRALRAVSLRQHGRDAVTLRPLFEAARFGPRGTYDVIHCHFGPAGLHGLRWRDAGIGRCLVVTFHANDLVAPVRVHGPRCYERLFRRADLLIAVSEYGKRKLLSLGAPAEKIAIHPNAVDWVDQPPATLDRLPGQLRLVSVGRLVEKKGFDDAIAAAALVASWQPKLTVHLKILGDGPLASDLKRLSDQAPLNLKVEFGGAVDLDTVLSAMQNADVALQPSKTGRDGDEEGQPVAILEAMSLGLPVIATWHAGIPELVEHGRTGLLAAEGDTEALASYLEELHRRPELARQIGRAAREYVAQNRSLDTLTENLIELYARAVRQRR